MPSLLTIDPQTTEMTAGKLPQPYHEWRIEIPTHTVAGKVSSATMPTAFRPNRQDVDEFMAATVPTALWVYWGTLRVADLPAGVSSLALQRAFERRFGVELLRLSAPPHTWPTPEASGSDA